MPATLSPAEAERSICALEGCGTPVVRSPGGGRPRLYCSDAHRAQARRQRLRARSPVDAAGTGGLAAAAGLLEEVLDAVHRAADAPARPAADLAAERARATAALLDAQRAAADAAARAAALDEQLTAERRAWQATRAELDAARRADEATIHDLQAVLEGTRQALTEEVERHDADVAAAEQRHELLARTEATRCRRLTEELDRCRATLGEATGHARAADSRAARSEQEAAEGRRSSAELATRLAVAEEAAREAGCRVDGLQRALDRARADAADERRRHERDRRDLQRRMVALARASRPAPGRRRRES